MVHLTADYIVRYNGHTKKQRDEPTNHYLKRITHLYMAERSIESIDNLSACRNLTVLYLYDNKLSHTLNLGTAQNLTHLYLQNNNISKIEGLMHLSRLIKLYVGYNRIAVVEGLQNLYQLSELHIENQRIPDGEKVLFDPRSIITLGRCLAVLNISGNKLDSLSDLSGLHELTCMYANDNEITEFADVKSALHTWRKLNKMELSGNPICHKSKYRDKIILLSGTLETLDGKVIKPMERRFLLSWQASREMRLRHTMATRQITDLTNGNDLPPLQQPLLPAAPPPHYTMGGLPGGRKRFEAILAKSRSLPASAAQPPEGKRPQQYSSPAIRPLPDRSQDEVPPDAAKSKRLNRQMTPHPNNTRWMKSRNNYALNRENIAREKTEFIHNITDGPNKPMPSFETSRTSLQLITNGRQHSTPVTNGTSNGIRHVQSAIASNNHGKRLNHDVDNMIINNNYKLPKPTVNGSNVGDNMLERGMLAPLPSPRMDGEGNTNQK